jgi:hypothetical protein
MRLSHLRRLAALVPLLLCLLGSPALGQQLEEEDLPEPELWEEAMDAYVEAEKVFNSRNQLDSLALFDLFLSQVADTSTVEQPPDEIHALVASSYFYRARVNNNFGSSEDVEQDLRQLLTRDPGFDFDRSLVSSKFADLFDDVKEELVAQIIVTVDPPDSRSSVGRWVADTSGMMSLPAGNHVVRVERPGYAAVDAEVEATTGSTATLEVTLERIAAVLTVFTVDENVEILIDGASRAFSARSDASDPGAGSQVVLDDLDTGVFELAARKDGFREYLANATIDEYRDYSLGPIELVPTSGEVQLTGLPAGTVVRANGEIVTPRFGGAAPTLSLNPGEYRIAMAHPDRGLFEADVVIEDQGAVEIAVRLRPPLVLLGILGGDESTASRVTQLLAERLSALDRWALIERAGAGTPILEAAGVDVATLRAYAQTGSRQAIPWDRIQAEADKRAEGGLYILGVLSNDLLAEHVHTFLLPKAPLPSRPDLVNLSVDPTTIDALGARLDTSVLMERPALGALVVDSPAAAGPLVVQVSAGGAAALAGLDVGDEIVSIDGVAIESVAQLRREMAARTESHGSTGKTAPLGVSAAGGNKEAQLGISMTPVIIELGATDVLYSAAAYELAEEEQNEDGAIAKWVVQLNQAVVFLHGGDLQGAIQLLRSITAPPDGPLGQAQINYLLGLALGSAGGEYAQTAIGFLSQAAEYQDGRLYHADGPLIAPRAQARMQSLN